MKQILKLGFLLASLTVIAVAPAFGQSDSNEYYRQWVDYRDGEISVTFDQIPVDFALHAIHARTGIQIIVPSSATANLVNLRLPRQPVEPALRSIISTIGYNNFAMMYDDEGRPHRAVVLGTVPIESPAEEPAAPQPLAKGERERLQRDLERWAELDDDERDRIEERLKSLPASDDRENLVKEYGRQILGIN